jgi:hypothetical protein
MSLRSLAVAAVFPVFVLGGCASAENEEFGFPAPGEPVTIEVDHNAPTAATVTVYLIRAGGIRQRVGTVSPGRVERFDVRPTSAAGDFVLVAETADGRVVQSRPFAFTRPEGVRWNLDLNAITPRTNH